MSLELRVEDYDKLCASFQCERPNPLIAVHTIESDLWQRLRLTAAIYMSKCLPGDEVILDEKELLDAYVTHEKTLKNMTPNGMIVPKRHTVLEYNALVRAFADLVDSLGFQHMIQSWHVPMNLRIKYGEVNEANLERRHPTEHVHSDSWAGESTESVTTHLCIFGDTARNHLVFYAAPPDFEEEWLGPRHSYADGFKVAEKYAKIDFVPERGQLILADFASLHASNRLPGAGPRVSIDTTFHLKRAWAEGDQEVIHPSRIAERAAHEVLKGIGESHLFMFPDGVDDHVDANSGLGFKHATNLVVVDLLK